VSTNALGRIGVLMGGPSSEREISLKSGKAVYQALRAQGIDVVPIDIRTHSIAKVKRAGISLAFIALHGSFGEDGTVQKMLEEMQIPYTGSGAIASYLCMDKVASRRIFAHHNIPVPEFEIFHRHSKRSLQRPSLKFPLVLKPSNQGSSIGVGFAYNLGQFKAMLKACFAYDDTIIAERYIPGREITVSILDDEPLPIVEIVPKSTFFDFEAKYQKGKSEYIVPARINRTASKRAQEIALEAHYLLGCRGFSRVDMILNKGVPYVLEVNSIPGLTEMSLLPMAAKAQGTDFSQLCMKIIQLARKDG
jgi:D-alanine-D-alanine ligase